MVRVVASNPVDHVLDHTLWQGTVDVGPYEVPLMFTKHMLGVTISAGLVLITMTLVARQVKRAVAGNRATHGHVANFFEVIILFIRNEMVLPNMGAEGLKYIPWFLTFFFFILFNNLLGMVPEIGTPTGNFMVTSALAGTVFLLIFGLGMWEQGAFSFFKNLVPHGVPWWLWPLMFVIEMISPVARCFALSMRLFANMLAGHIVLAALLMIPIVLDAAIVGVPFVLVAVGMGFLEIFVSFLQAYIFTLLSIIFIGAAVHPEH
jgi:F-type H+-transporting ATPase subunit a